MPRIRQNEEAFGGGTEQDCSSFNIDVNRLMKVMSEIMSEKYGCKVTMTAVKKEDK